MTEQMVEAEEGATPGPAGPEAAAGTDGFAALGLSETALRAVAAAGFEAPTPIQERAIPVMMAVRDLVAQAQTGTGKTAAFALPMIEGIDPDRPVPQALVLVPT